MTTTDVVDSAIDLPWRNFQVRSFGQSPEFRTKSQTKATFGDTHISLQHTVGQVEGRPHAKTQLDLIRPVVSTQHRHVTDGLQTDTYATTAYTALPIL